MSLPRQRAVEMATLWKPQNGFHKGLGHRAQNARCPHSHKPHQHRPEKGADADPALDTDVSFGAP